MDPADKKGLSKQQGTYQLRGLHEDHSILFALTQEDFQLTFVSPCSDQTLKAELKRILGFLQITSGMPQCKTGKNTCAFVDSLTVTRKRYALEKLTILMPGPQAFETRSDEYCLRNQLHQLHTISRLHHPLGPLNRR